MKLHFYADPGHGWLRVPTSLIKRLNLTKEITGLSYISPSKKYMYLEEDVDMGTFLEAYGLSAGPIKETYTNNESAIRKNQNYSEELI